MKITVTMTDGTEHEVGGIAGLAELKPGDRAQVGAWYAVPEIKPGHALSVMPDGTIAIHRLETE